MVYSGANRHGGGHVPLAGAATLTPVDPTTSSSLLIDEQVEPELRTKRNEIFNC
jgi:hypothetical protein